MSISRGLSQGGAAILSKRLAQNHRLDEILETAVFSLQFGQHVLDHFAVTELEFAAERVSEQFFSEALGELIAATDHEVAEFRWPLKLITARQFARSINRVSSAVVVAPRSNRIVVFQGKTARIDLAMALGTTGRFAVLRQLFA